MVDFGVVSDGLREDIDGTGRGRLSVDRTGVALNERYNWQDGVRSEKEGDGDVIRKVSPKVKVILNCARTLPQGDSFDEL